MASKCPSRSFTLSDGVGLSFRDKVDHQELYRLKSIIPPEVPGVHHLNHKAALGIGRLGASRHVRDHKGAREHVSHARERVHVDRKLSAWGDLVARDKDLYFTLR